MDAAISEASPTNNYATTDLLVGKSSGQALESFLQFDLGSLPANAILTAAELRLTSSGGFGAGGNLALSIPGAGWSETTITWSNRPIVTALGDIALVVDGPTTAHLAFPEAALAHFQEIVHASTVNRGLALAFPAAAADQLLTFKSRASVNTPQLVITFDLGPELPDYLARQGRDDGRFRAAIFPAPAGAAAPQELIWSTAPGVRYNLWESPDLSSWTQVSGYPAVADALTGKHEIQTDLTARFFSVQILDEQAPEIVRRFPDDGGFGIKRFYPDEEIGIRLSDFTGVDPATISLTLDGLGTFTAADPELTYIDGLLTLNLGGDTAMGAYGAPINASLTVADLLGNSATYDWSFELEKQIVFVDGLFTFGSPSAQRAGQRVPPIPTRVLADRAGGGGPIRANDSEWTIESVTADSLVLAYTSTSAPVFTIGQYLNNMCPATVDEIFYRKVISIADNAVAKKLTLGTVDVPAWEIVKEGSVSLSQDDIAFEADAEGRIIRAYQMKSVSGSASKSLQPLQIDWADEEIMGIYKNKNGIPEAEFGLPINDKPPVSDAEWDFKLTLKQATLRLRPTIAISVETSFLSLKKLYSECTVEVDSVLEPEFEFIVPAIDYDYDHENAKTKEPLIKRDFRIPLGPSGLWVTVSPRLRFETSITAGLTGTFSLGASGGYTQTMVFDYNKDLDPRLKITGQDGDAHFDLIEPEIAVGGTAGFEVKVKPEIDVKVVSAAGFYVNFDPTLSGDLNADLNTGNLSADIGMNLNINFNAGLSILFFDNDLLPSFEPWDIYEKEWRWYFPESLVDVPLEILVQPASQSVAPGGILQLSVQGNHETGVSYEWKHNERRLFENSDTLKIYGVTSASAGDYQVTLRYGSEEVLSEVASVTVAVSPPVITGEFVLIPAGSFQMGDAFSEGWVGERPVHTVNVSAFYMAKYETTKELWDSVRAWGLNNGYPDLRAGNGSDASKGANHPVHSISWYDMVKWCNARSQKEGLTPCYTVGGAVFKTGEDSSVACNFAASGYRLPTEAEWEKAARGGLSGKRFPWGDTISHSEANYRANGSRYVYDVSLYTSWTDHPDYDDGAWPYSSPVGSFAPNRYGLYDMAGNMWEWCWDWFDSRYYGTSPASDPRGRTSGLDRVFRGGCWFCIANVCRTALRAYYDPTVSNRYFGFRVARSLVPQ